MPRLIPGCGPCLDSRSLRNPTVWSGDDRDENDGATVTKAPTGVDDAVWIDGRKLTRPLAVRGRRYLSKASSCCNPATIIHACNPNPGLAAATSLWPISFFLPTEADRTKYFGDLPIWGHRCRAGTSSDAKRPTCWDQQWP